jgi:2-methylcitrate dehydratase PrpD
LELDEGNKYARGHPASHGFPAVLALAAHLDSDGATTAAALLVAYEVGARFGRATSLRTGTHPHGNWGVTGAAAGCSRLLGLGPAEMAAAIDAGAGLPIAGHFSSALDGNPVRDAWIGASNLSGLAAARMAAAGLARNTGTAGHSMGDLLGSFDPEALVEGLGSRWDILSGYFKRHASCSFTHPAADAALELRLLLGAGATNPMPDVDTIDRITVETHSLGAGLDAVKWDNRLSAMFSTPFVVASAMVHGRVDPAASAPGELHDPRVESLARRVRVVTADDLDARLPHERAARVTVRTTHGAQHALEMPNPIGDADHHPFDRGELLAVMKGLLGRESARRLLDAATRLPESGAVAPLLRPLADP